MRLSYLTTAQTFKNHASRFMAENLVLSGVSKRLGCPKTLYRRSVDNKVSDAPVSQIVNLEISFSDLGHSARIGASYIGATNSFQESRQDNVAVTSDRQHSPVFFTSTNTSVSVTNRGQQTPR